MDPPLSAASVEPDPHPPVIVDVDDVGVLISAHPVVRCRMQARDPPDQVMRPVMEGDEIATVRADTDSVDIVGLRTTDHAARTPTLTAELSSDSGELPRRKGPSPVKTHPYFSVVEVVLQNCNRHTYNPPPSGLTCMAWRISIPAPTGIELGLVVFSVVYHSPS